MFGFINKIYKLTFVASMALVLWAIPLQAVSDSINVSPAMEMNLSEAIGVALRFNRAVKIAFLDRVTQKFDLKVAQDKFNPDLDFDSATTYTGSETHTRGQENSSSANLGLSSTLSATKQIETGGQFTFSWSRQDGLSDDSNSAQDRIAVNSWAISFTHPLLKGAGVDVNTASVTLAEINEQSNILSHRDTIISIVNSTISAFRSYAQSARQMDIIKASLERSRANLRMNRLLIDIGRMPANEIIQNESDVANQEFAYETALNDLDNARLTLLKVLNLPRDTRIFPIEETDMLPTQPDFDTCLAAAFKNRSDHLNAKMSLERARIDLVLARNNMKWGLDLSSGVSTSLNSQRNSANSDDYALTVGLKLNIPIYGDLTRKQTLLSAQTAQKKTELNFNEIRQNITLEVQDAVREVKIRLKQVGMAERSRQLSEKKLDIETEKLKVGRTTNFQLVSFQNDLVDSQNAEVNAKVDYLNALTALDTILGTTLETWQIDYNKEYDKWPGK